MADDIEDRYNQRVLKIVAGGKPPAPPRALHIATDPWAEADLPQRPWIAKGYLLRGSVTVLAGQGAAGKSMLALGYSVSLVFGTEWGRFLPVRACRVLVLNAEDDDDEQRLRLSAVLRQHGRTPADLDGNLARVSLPDTSCLVDYDPSTGQATPTALLGELDEFIAAFRPDVVCLDPLVELHSANENDNQALRAVVSCLRRVARAHNCAILLVHHARKGSAASAGDPDMIRGAGAIVGAARVALTVVTMTADEARDLGIADDRRSFFFRVDGAKSNYAPLRDAEWYEKIEYVLDNGETVSAAMPWFPAVKTLDAGDYDRLLRAIATASPPLSPRISHDPRSFRYACEAIGVGSKEAQQRALGVLMRQYGVTEGYYSRPGKGRADRNVGLRSGDGQPAARWVDDNPGG